MNLKRLDDNPGSMIETNRQATVNRLYPDQEKFKELKNRRMELTESLTSIMLDPVSTDDRRRMPEK